MLFSKTTVALALLTCFGFLGIAFAQETTSPKKKIVAITEHAGGFTETGNATEALFAVHVSFHIPGHTPTKLTHYFKQKIAKTIRYDDGTWASSSNESFMGGSIRGCGQNGWGTTAYSATVLDEGIKIDISDRRGNRDCNTPTGAFKHQILLKWTDSRLHEEIDGVPFDAAFEWFK